MNLIYFDCTNGISGDMARKALLGLCEDEAFVDAELEKLHFHDHGHHHDHFHRSYQEIKGCIENSELGEGVKEKALSIYSVIAKAEAAVHGTTIEDVHFHEVGRAEAVMNIVGIAACIETLKIDKIYCSEIHDGSGFIECSHGVIPVPVPAVMQMRADCDYEFVTDPIETEMVTPTGLAILMGLGAVFVPEIPEGQIVKTAVGYGKRQTGKDGGLRVTLLTLFKID